MAMVAALSSSSRSSSSDRLAAKLADPALGAALSHFVRARVPETEVADIVQSTLAAALDADEAATPIEDEDIVRWVHGICRHKVVDWFRRSRREIPRDLEDETSGQPVAAAESAPQSAMDLLRWAQKELPAGEENAKTLEWMLREGAGEKLENIAAEANVPAPRVRQRVSRLRRYYKARWAAQAAALAALLLIALAIALALRQRKEEVAPAPVPTLTPVPVPTTPEPPAPELPAVGPQSQVPPAPSSSASPPDDSALKPIPTSQVTPAPRSSTPAPLLKKPQKASPTRGGRSEFSDPTTPVPPPPAPTESLGNWGKKPSPK
jgi:DNA-directed RNA polymerase specialized sigma24 family protein